MMKEIKLPQMQEYFFMPWWPIGQPNKKWWGKLREDLSDDSEVHYWHGEHWTLDELYKYGALPPLPPK